MRHAQLLSLDALLAVVLIIFMLGAVSATSENLRAGITDLIGWYDKTSIPDSMLDVLLRSPGKPEDWNNDVSKLLVPGLASTSTGYVDYKKTTTFFELLEKGDRKSEEFLTNLSLGHPFLLEFYIGSWEFKVDFSWNPNGGDIPAGTLQYSCSDAIEINYHKDQPSYIDCPNLRVMDTSINSSCSICVSGSVTITKTSDGPITGIYMSGSCPDWPSSYLAVGGDLVLEGSSAAVKVDTGIAYLFVKGAVSLKSSSNAINVRNSIYVFGDTGTTPLLYIGGAPATFVAVNGGIFFKVKGKWYTVNANVYTDLLDKSNWYVWDKSSKTFKSLETSGDIVIHSQPGNSPPITVVISGVQVMEIDSSSFQIISRVPSGEWTPPEPPFCFGSVTSVPPMDVSSITGNYTYPRDLPSEGVWNRVAYSGKKFWVNPSDLSTVLKNRNDSEWVSYSERSTVVDSLVYNESIKLNKDSSKVLLFGLLKYPIPEYAYLNISVPKEEGYILFVVLNGDKLKALGVWRAQGATKVSAELWEKNGASVIPSKTYIGTETYVLIPWTDLFSGPAKAERPVMLYLYSMGDFTSTVELRDQGNIGALLAPVHEPALVKLWVWDER